MGSSCSSVAIAAWQRPIYSGAEIYCGEDHPGTRSPKGVLASKKGRACRLHKSASGARRREGSGE